MIIVHFQHFLIWDTCYNAKKRQKLHQSHFVNAILKLIPILHLLIVKNLHDLSFNNINIFFFKYKYLYHTFHHIPLCHSRLDNFRWHGDTTLCFYSLHKSFCTLGRTYGLGILKINHFHQPIQFFLSIVVRRSLVVDIWTCFSL